MIKLIIVDDEKSTRQGLLENVPWKELGIGSVADAEDGAKALELAASICPDIVLTDVRMPKMDGIELAKQLKDKFPECKVIFLSGYTDKEYLKSAIQLQAVSYIEKPVDLDEVKAVIAKAVSIYKDEIEKKRIESSYKSTMSENISLVREKLALEILHSHSDINSIIEKFSYIKTGYSHNDYFLSAIIKLNLYNDEYTQAASHFRSNIQEEIRQWLSVYSLSCISGFKDNSHIIMHIYGENIRNSFVIKKAFDTIKDNIKATYQNDFKMFIGVGKSVKGISNIPEAYQSAVITLQKQFFSGYNKILFYDEGGGIPYSLDENTVKQFSDLIKKGKKPDVISFIKKISGDLHVCDNTLINNVKDFFFKIIVDLSKAAEELGAQITEQGNNEEFFWDVISKKDTLNEVESYTIDKVDLFFKYKHERENSSNAVFNIMKYIRNNYHDEKLSIKAISEYTFLTPNYLCLIFKKETCKTINQYITEIRIEKAKEYLNDRRKKLYEVAYSVGYSDPNYFAKIFKKVAGLNPSEYREYHTS